MTLNVAAADPRDVANDGDHLVALLDQLLDLGETGYDALGAGQYRRLRASRG